jgi:short-subunit dehydrogenase
MKDFTKCYGTWVLIAGAAEGLGAAFTEAVARKKVNIIMVDIKRSSLEELALKMEKIYGVRTIQLVMDLSLEDSVMKCMHALGDLDCRLLIYIPAHSPVKLFLHNTEEELDKYINLNALTPMKLVLGFANRVKEEKHSGIVLMSSLAGLTGPQYTAPYAATKAFTNTLGEALYYEFKRYNTDVLVCCAGPVSTPTYWGSQPAQKKTDSNVLDPSVVAEYALKKLGKQAICIPGWRNRLVFFFLLHFLPRKTASYLVNKAMARLYPQFKPLRNTVNYG